jgi:hypothetical protein
MVMSRDRNAKGIQNIKIGNSSFEGWKSSSIWKNLNISKFYSGMNQKPIEARNAYYLAAQNLFDFKFSFQKHKDESIQNYNFACCFVWV